jgi:hypothetical protein
MRVNGKVFIRRDGLGCQLTTNPIRGLGENDSHASTKRREGGRTPSEPTAEDCQIRLKFVAGF